MQHLKENKAEEVNSASIRHRSRITEKTQPVIEKQEEDNLKLKKSSKYANIPSKIGSTKTVPA